MHPIDARTRVVVVLGYPIGHSLSPAIHNAAFSAQDLNYRYVACPVRPAELPQAIEGVRALHFAGANVTLPHKQAAVRHLDELTPEAKAVGAVNTIVRIEQKGGARLRGDNTDVRGFLAPLDPYASRIQDSEAVVFGSGGATRAVLFGLLDHFRLSRLTVVARNEPKAESLCRQFDRFRGDTALEFLPPGQARDAVRSSTLVVNATPLGMAPNAEGTIWEPVDDFQDHHIVYDLVYNPARTRLLREAGSRGATTVDGLAMFIAQAAASYRQWTGCEMAVDAAREALEAALGRRE